MTDEVPNDTRRDRLLLKTLPGWVILATVIFIVVTRDNVSEVLVGTLLGFAAVALGLPFVIPGRK